MSINMTPQVNALFNAPFPYEVLLECTSACNYRCVHCYLGDDFRNSILTYQDIENIISQLHSLGTLHIKLTGGEPLTHPQLREILKLIKENGMRITLYTNASLINEDNILWIDQYVDEYKVSIYGASEGTYEKVAKSKGVYKKFIHGVALLVNTKKPILGSIILLKDNYHELKDMYLFCKENGISATAGMRICPERNGCESNCEHAINDEQFYDAILFALQKTDIADTKQESVPSKEQLTNEILNSHPCGAGVFSIAIRSDGEVLPCIQLDIPYGNIRKGTLHDFYYKNETAIALRNMRISDFRSCRECEDLVNCSICLSRLYTDKKTLIPVGETIICNDTQIIKRAIKSLTEWALPKE